MLKLCGIGISNYYNKVKLALLEKGIPFTEQRVPPSQDETVLSRSPIGKIPFIEVDGKYLSESQSIIEYLEEAWPLPPLYPRDPFERAKCRELIFFVELYLELPARRLLPHFLFGAPLADGVRDEVRETLQKNLGGLRRLARFDPYIAGREFTCADCAAFVHLPVVSLITTRVFGRDFMAEVETVKPYLALLNERPHAQKVASDREAAMQEFAKRRRQG